MRSQAGQRGVPNLKCQKSNEIVISLIKLKAATFQGQTKETDAGAPVYLVRVEHACNTRSKWPSRSHD